MQKECLQCGKLFEKKQTTSLKEWETRKKFCSKQCHNLSKIGGTSWNKGLKGVQVAWNKGKKLHYSVWNKGKAGNYHVSPERKIEMAEMIRNYWDNVTPEQRKVRGQKISKALKGNIPATTFLLGVKSKLWKGEQANYNSKHRWIQKHWNKTDICEDCGRKVLPRVGTRLHHATHWANISREYKRDRKDWKELCPKCHRLFDNLA